MSEDIKCMKNRVKFAGSWFELDDFAQRHPGGDGFIHLFNGRDVTHAFRSYHPHFTDNRIRSVLRKVKNDNEPVEEDDGDRPKKMNYEENRVVKKHAKAYIELQAEV